MIDYVHHQNYFAGYDKKANTNIYYGLKCYLANDLVCSLPFSFKKAILIEPSTQKDIALNFSDLKEGYFRLDFIHQKKKMIIQI